MIKRFTLITLYIFVFLSISACTNTSQDFKGIFPTHQTSDLLQSQQMKEDLDTLYEALLNNHPEMDESGFRYKYTKEFKELYDKVKNPMPRKKFYFIVVQAMMLFKDAHTLALYPLDSEDDELISLDFLWLKDGMIISKDEGSLKRGDKIITLGDKTPSKILEEMQKRRRNWNFIS